MSTTPINSGDDGGLNLLLPGGTFEEPLWKSLFRNLDDFFFPKKLPPLVLQSKPVPVKDIWGFYNYKKNGAAFSSVTHVLLLAAIIGGTILARNMVKQDNKSATVTKLTFEDIPALPPSKTKVGGGGGGGDRDKLQASKGKLPKLSMEQIVPPMVVVRNQNPKLTAEPTVVIPPR